jgi:hypothetical protein
MRITESEAHVLEKKMELEASWYRHIEQSGKSIQSPDGTLWIRKAGYFEEYVSKERKTKKELANHLVKSTRYL